MCYIRGYPGQQMEEAARRLTENNDLICDGHNN